MAHSRLAADLGALWSTLIGSLALLRGQGSVEQLDTAMRRKYSERIELETARREALAGLTPGERRLFAAHLAPAARVLDIGCAGGRVTIGLERDGYRVVGVDLTEAMIRQAAQLGRDLGLALDVQVMDARRLGFRDRSFDAALMVGSVIGYIHGRVNRVRALGEARRVLRPGGAFIVVTPSRECAWKFRAWFAALGLVHRVLGLAGRASRWEVGDRVGPAWSGDTTRLVYWHMYSPSELAADLRAAGFEIVGADRDSYMMSFVARRPRGQRPSGGPAPSASVFAAEAV